MLISPASVLPTGEEWAFEVKWDGMRALVSVGPAVRVHSRHDYDHTAAFPELTDLGSLASRSKVVLDGELVCLDAATGRPSFECLMARTQARLPTLAARQHAATFMAFDVLAVDGQDICARPWGERRQLLHELYELTPDEGVWRVSTAFADGPGLLAATAGMGLEGVVAKRVTSRYWPGRRTPYWRKVKHKSYEWFELLGWRAPKGRDPGGVLAGRDGRLIASAFPALPSTERQRLAALLAEHGVQVPSGVELPAGVAEVEVGYQERLPAGRLREPVASAVRLVGGTPARGAWSTHPASLHVRAPHGDPTS
jgi:bifunctional non-homologous end joining protein LigD